MKDATYVNMGKTSSGEELVLKLSDGPNGKLVIQMSPSKCPRCGTKWVLNHDKDGFMCPNAISHLIEDGENLIRRLMTVGMTDE